MKRNKLCMRVSFAVALALMGCRSSSPEGSSSQPASAPASPPTKSGPIACASSEACPSGRRCSTELGECSKPPGCKPGEMCPQVCYGTCVDVGSASAPGSCGGDAECRLFSDYCTACDCRALARDEAEPKCSGPGVRCLTDPCEGRRASCVEGRCRAVEDRAVE